MLYAHSVSSGGAQDIGFELGGEIGWQKEKEQSASGSASVTAIHGFYNV